MDINSDLIRANLSNKQYNATKEALDNPFLKLNSMSTYSSHLGVLADYNDPNLKNKDPLDIKNTYNINTNSGIFKYLYSNGGVSASQYYNTNWEYISENNQYKVKDRKNYYNIDYSMQCVKVASPFIWTGNGNYCGFNFVPPNNTIFILQKDETGRVYANGTIPSNSTIMNNPQLYPGEISISGYGNNYILWNQSDKINIYCKAKEGDIDINDPSHMENNNSGKKNVTTCEVEINLNANDRYIEIITRENDENLDNSDYTSFNSYPREPDGKQMSRVIITPTDIELYSENDKEENTRIVQNSNSIIQTLIFKEKSINQIISENNIQTFFKKNDNEYTKIEQTENYINREVKKRDKTTTEKITEDTVEINTDNYIVHASNIELENHNIKKDKIEFDIDEFIVNSKYTTMKSEEETIIHSEDKIDINNVIDSDDEDEKVYPDEETMINIKGIRDI